MNNPFINKSFQSSDRQEVAYCESESSKLTQQFSKYIYLRNEERKLRERVNFLEEKAALYGPLKLDVNLAMLLEEQKTDLDKKRREMDLLESQLQSKKDIPLEQQTEIYATKLEKLLSDVKAKREQILTYQDNLNYLEEKQAKLGLDTGVDLINELKLTQGQLETIKNQVKNLEYEIESDWLVKLEDIQKLPTMSAEEIETFAKQIVDQNKRLYKREQEALPYDFENVDPWGKLSIEEYQRMRDEMFKRLNEFLKRQEP